MDTNDDELANLIARCALRDQASFKRLYERVGGYLNAVIFRIVKSSESADEVLQEAFIQIWERADTYRPHLSKPLTWMTSIARYRALDRLEKEQRHTQRIQASSDEEDDGLENIADTVSETPELAMETAQHGRNIQNCLSHLNEKVQTCVLLAYLEGYSREEIAEKMRTNTNTVKSWLRRGAQKLKDCLESKL